MKIVDDKLLDEFRGPGRCEWCGKQVRRRDPHHVFTRGAGRLDVRVNLVALCATFAGGEDCHQSHHNGNGPTQSQLLAVVAAREGTTRAAITLEVYRLRLKPKGSEYDAGSRETVPDDPLAG